MILRASLICMLVTLTAACSSSPTKPPPAEFDLTGRWVVDEARSEPLPTPKKRRRDDNRRGSMPQAAILSSFPMLYCREMRIEQSGDSMGIDYEPGPYRDVSWGERDRRTADISAGWVDGVLVIETRDSRFRLEERYRLVDGGKALELWVSAEPDRGEEIVVTRVFSR